MAPVAVGVALSGVFAEAASNPSSDGSGPCGAFATDGPDKADGLGVTAGADGSNDTDGPGVAACSIGDDGSGTDVVATDCPSSADCLGVYGWCWW